MTFSVCARWDYIWNISTLLLRSPRSPQGAPDEINMFYKESDVGHTQTAAIACLPKTLEYGGGRRTSEQTKLWSLNHNASDRGG